MFMLWRPNSLTDKVTISLRAPVLFLIISAIAIPVELRPPVPFELTAFRVSDVVQNIIGFLPVGFVLGELGLWRAVLISGVLSTLSEFAQKVMAHRDPQGADIAANVLGALVGAAVSVYWRISSPSFSIGRWKGLVAAASALGLVTFFVWPFHGLNGRGVTSPGVLEAHWKFDETRGRLVFDSSGHGLNGTFGGAPKRVAGINYGAVQLDGREDYIRFGRPTALRLVGSMTISAWIKPTSFPFDDAAVVSQFTGDNGYQLDTTIDRGPRTIGFKLINACGVLMARYGATPLTAGIWYHIAGVYDAEARTLDVYLNGRLDDGSLVGSVTGTQHSSYATVYVGRRSDLDGFEFAGSIEDVRVYSAALTKTEIESAMRGSVIDIRQAQRAGSRYAGVSPLVRKHLESPCGVQSQHEDKNLPLAAALSGTFAAIACVGLLPSSGPLWWLFCSLAAGLSFLPVTAPILPAFDLWLIPLVSLAGGASVAVSAHRARDREPASLI